LGFSVAQGRLSWPAVGASRRRVASAKPMSPRTLIVRVYPNPEAWPGFLTRLVRKPGQLAILLGARGPAGGERMARKEILSTWEAGNYCHLSPYTIRLWVNSGRLKAYTTPGGHRRIHRQDLDEFLKAHHMPMPGDFREGKRRFLALVPEELGGLPDLLESWSPDLEARLTSSPFEAGLSLSAYSPDIFLVDLDDSRWDGVGVCRLIHGSPETSDIRVAALSRRADVDVYEALQKAGVLAIFSRPLDPDELFRFLRKQFPYCKWVR
jgi:excisionase family DNA binding protein